MDSSTEFSVLLTLAQLGVAAFGFTGLVAVFKPSSEEFWLEEEFNGIKFILEHAGAVVILSLLPAMFCSGGRCLYYMWSVLSVLLLIVISILSVIQANLSRSATERGKGPRLPLLHKYLYPFLNGLAAILAAMNVCFNISALYTGSIIILLFHCGMQYYVFVFKSKKAPSKS
jgi:hypothetical protein